MFFKFLRFIFLAGLFAFSQAKGKRISQIKCEEYISSTASTTGVIYMTLDPVPSEIRSYNCSKSVDLILGGEAVAKGEFRHHVLIGWESETPQEYLFDCGGTLISDRYVMTAAHCAGKAAGRNPQPTIVRFGELNLKQDDIDQFDIQIESILKHPQHRFGASYHDIALVRLKEKVPFSDLVQPACLWDDVTTNVSSVIATGFGQTGFYEDQGSDTLLKVQLEIVNSSECSEEFRGNRKFFRGMTDQQLCVGSRDGNRDTCQGDSGGPLQVLLNPEVCTYHVIGITSLGSMCGGNSPAVYTKVASYIDWIESVVWGS